MPSFGSATLSLVFLVAGYVAARCLSSPNKATTLHTTDRIRFVTTYPAVVFTHAFNLVALYQALVTLFSTSSPTDRAVIDRICPYPQHLDPDRVSWNLHTVGSLAIFAVGAYIRLQAYGGLGRNFTFQLAAPDRLVTTGVYQYLQHPSYTGMVLVLLGYLSLLVNRLDTPIACWIPDEILAPLRQWGVVLALADAALTISLLGVRIRDEERMLKEKFGREWEEWHARTARRVLTPKMGLIKRTLKLTTYTGLASVGAFFLYTRNARFEPMIATDPIFSHPFYRQFNPEKNPTTHDLCIRRVPLREINPSLLEKKGKLVEAFCAGVWSGWGYAFQRAYLSRKYESPETATHLWSPEQLASSSYEVGTLITDHFEVVEKTAERIVVRCGDSPRRREVRASDGLFEISAVVKPEDGVAEFGLKSCFYQGLGKAAGEPMPPHIVWLHQQYTKLLAETALGRVRR
ncbi:hypothetical protein BJX61DRAFT_551089 [Aspergillus egyptiacus]|nr:hypothetical protein BJX61DRAFT_551089 [Aspergillus egyptiacus]